MNIVIQLTGVPVQRTSAVGWSATLIARRHEDRIQLSGIKPMQRTRMQFVVARTRDRTVRMDPIKPIPRKIRQYANFQNVRCSSKSKYGDAISMTLVSASYLRSNPSETCRRPIPSYHCCRIANNTSRSFKQVLIPYWKVSEVATGLTQCTRAWDTWIRSKQTTSGR